MKRQFPLFIIDTSRAHGRARETDYVACTSKELPFVAELTLLNEAELVIDRDWTDKSPFAIYSNARAGIRAKLKIVDFPIEANLKTLQSLMKRGLKEWEQRRQAITVSSEDISDEVVLAFIETLQEQTRENLRESPYDAQAHMVAAILNKIRSDYE